MNIIGVILNKLMSSKCVSTTVISYDDFKQTMQNYSIATIVGKLDNDSYLFIDAYKLFDEQPLELSPETPVTNWEELTQYLNNFEADILQKYFTTTHVPRIWEYEKNKFELTPFFANVVPQLRIRSIDNSFGFDVQYCDHDNFYERRNLGRSWNYPDISIINTSAGDSIDLNNSIPVVNGAVFYPEVIHNTETGYDELVAHEAGKWLITSDWNQSNVRTVKHHKIPYKNTIIEDEYAGGEPPLESSYCYNKGIMLIDFSPIGTIKKIKLSDCSNGKVEHGPDEVDLDNNVPNADRMSNIHTAYIKGDIEYPRCTYYTISFDLPKETEMGIPIVCICGRLFYLHEDTSIEIKEDGTITLHVDIDKKLFNNILLSNLQWFGKQNLGTGFVESYIQLTLNELFINTEYGNGTAEDIQRLRHEDNSIPFVIMLYTDKTLMCTKTDPIMTIGPDKFLFPPNAGGLLVNKKTREIVDYVRQFYNSGTLVETAQQRPINYLTNDIKQLTRRSLAFEFNKYKSPSKYMKFNMFEPGRDLDKYMLVDIAFKEK